MLFCRLSSDEQSQPVLSAVFLSLHCFARWLSKQADIHEVIWNMIPDNLHALIPAGGQFAARQWVAYPATDNEKSYKKEVILDCNYNVWQLQK